MRVTRLLQLVRNRRPVRRFADRALQADLIEGVLEAARYAPSAKEAQPWRFIVMQEALARHQIAAAAFNHPHARTAPVLILCCARIHSHISGSGRASFPIDLAAAMQTMAIAAADLGLHTSWISGFRESQVRSIVGIPNDVPIVGILGLGYPDGLEPLPERRAVEDVISWDRWQSGSPRRALP